MLYHMLNTAVENYYFIQIFVIVKSIPRQFIFFQLEELR